MQVALIVGLCIGLGLLLLLVIAAIAIVVECRRRRKPGYGASERNAAFAAGDERGRGGGRYLELEEDDRANPAAGNNNADDQACARAADEPGEDKKYISLVADPAYNVPPYYSSVKA